VDQFAAAGDADRLEDRLDVVADGVGEPYRSAAIAPVTSPRALVRRRDGRLPRPPEAIDAILAAAGPQSGREQTVSVAAGHTFR
jgi:hypothetical protein